MTECINNCIKFASAVAVDGQVPTIMTSMYTATGAQIFNYTLTSFLWIYY